MYKDICLFPWNVLRIEKDGNCYVCTSSYQKVKIGNIFTDTFDEIWNGDLIQNIRKNIIEKNDYVNCRTDLCIKSQEDWLNLLDKNNYCISKFPTIIYFAFDYSCLQKCVFCRDKVLMMDEEKIKEWEKVIKEKIYPIVKNLKYIEINHAGEFLDGVYDFQESLLLDLIDLNSNLKFNIISNGVNLTRNNILKYKLENRINTIYISLHCATRETYKKIFRRDNFDKVIENLNSIKELKSQGKIGCFKIMFVICSLNYKEIPLFIKLARKLNAVPCFSLMNYNGNSRYASDKMEYEVFSPEHRKYNDFVRIIHKKDVQEYMDVMPSCIRECKSVSLINVLKNYIKYYKNKSR